MSKYTPGPWAPHFDEAYYVTGPDLGRVAMMMNLKGAHGMGGRRTGAEAAANARLISAAPDLLMALRMLYDETADYIRLNNLGGMDNQCMQLARAAIAKATGALDKPSDMP